MNIDCAGKKASPDQFIRTYAIIPNGVSQNVALVALHEELRLLFPQAGLPFRVLDPLLRTRLPGRIGFMGFAADYKQVCENTGDCACSCSALH